MALLYQLFLVVDNGPGVTSMGRFDQYTWPFLKKELEEGTITLDEAQELVDAFFLKLNTYYEGAFGKMAQTAGIGNTYQHTTIGGLIPETGEDATNPVTYMTLETIARLKLHDPTISLRVHKNSPDEIWNCALETSRIVGGLPLFQNDDIIIPSMMDAGLSKEDACDYSIVGCVEPAGTGNEWPACGMSGWESIWNMMNIIQLVINGGVNPRTGITAVPGKKLYEYESFDEVREAFETQLRYILGWTVSYGNLFELVYSHYYPSVVASCMLDGCIEKGMDATEGGAKYNRTGLTACGAANVADSLMTIKKLCFDDKTVTLRELYDALQSNWEGFDNLRQMIINDVPHYGNDNDEVDELASWALGLFASILSNSEGPRGKYNGGTFTMTANVRMGLALGATPDGRKAGEPIADAISPRQGFDKNGPTSYLRSAAKLPHQALSNGDQLNIRFTPTAVQGDMGAEKLRQLIESYFALGGMQVQFNVVGTAQLYEAQKKPAEHRDLIVRIAGFSTYFVTLATETQNDFISRTEQAI